MENSKIDKSNMKKIITDFPKQFEEALELAKNTKVKGKFENIVICGLGGSALPGDILVCWLKDSKKLLPIYIHRDYNLPPQAGKNSLIMCISYSGNTEETISALKEAIKKNLNIAGIATGGKMEEICRQNNIPFVKIPSGIQPRSALGYIFTSVAKILINSEVIENKTKEIKQLVKDLKKTNQEKQGKEIANILVNKIPLVYSSNDFKCIARIWKIKFNENSKVPSFFNYFPELNHNEMVGFSQTKNSNFHVFILKDKKEDKRNLKRMDLFASIVKEKGIKVDFISIKEGNTLFKIFSTLLLGDWISYYLALNYKIDPTPVKIVEDFKKKMNK